MSFSNYIRVPPDSTGKKVAHMVSAEIVYAGLTGVFALDDVVTLATSGVNGTIYRIVIDSPTTGEIYVALNYESAINITAGENIQVNGATIALAQSIITLYTAQTALVDATNPFRQAKISSDGALLITNPDGKFSLDAYNKLRVSQVSTLGNYNFKHGLDDDKLSYVLIGSTAAYNKDWHGAEITTNTSPFSIAVITSDLYHKNVPGISEECLMGIAFGDSGKSGVIRDWGLSDRNNGVFFQLSGSVLNVCIRSDASGTPVDIKIPQSEWNTDKLDGSGGELNLSGCNVDVTKNCMWWIDFQYLSSGIVRFGVVWNGIKVLAHKYSSGGLYPYPFMGNADLPVTFIQYNLSAPISPSLMKVFGAVVLLESKTAPHVDYNFGTDMAISKVVTADPGDLAGYGTVVSMRNARNISSSAGLLENRSIIIPESLDMHSDSLIAFRIINTLQQSGSQPVMTGSYWTGDIVTTGTTIEYDPYGIYSGSDYSLPTSSKTIASGIVSANATYTYKWSEILQFERPLIIRRADIDSYPIFTVQVVPLLGIPSASVSLVFNWQEVR